MGKNRTPKQIEVTPELLAQREEWARRTLIPGVECRRMFTSRCQDYTLTYCGRTLATRTVILSRDRPVSETYVFHACVDPLGRPLIAT